MKSIPPTSKAPPTPDEVLESLTTALKKEHNAQYIERVKTARPLVIDGVSLDIRPCILAYATYYKDLGKDMRSELLSIASVQPTPWDLLLEVITYIVNGRNPDKAIEITNWSPGDCMYVYYVSLFDIWGSQKKTANSPAPVK